MGFFSKNMIQKIKTHSSDQQNGTREKEDFERVMFGEFPGLLILVDAQNHTIADLNDVAANAIGAQKNEIVGQNYHNYTRQAPAENPTAGFGEPLENAEGVLVTASGQSLAVLRSTTPVSLKGHPYYLEYFVDISGQKQVEEKLAAANRQIEAMKVELNVMTDAANNNIMTNIGHELRNPFNAIIGFTEMILDRQFGDLTPLQEEYLGDVAKSAHNLLALINDILDLTRVEGDKLKLNFSQVKLDDLLSRCLVLVKEKAAKHGIKMITDINLVDEVIEADERKLKQIIFNLLTGALKLTSDSGKVRLRAEIKGEDVCVSVEDTGLGIKKEDLESVFAPCEQADEPSNLSCQRIQPGLYHTRKLVEQHGGRIWAESEGEGKGACFSFLIPRKQNVTNS